MKVEVGIYNEILNNKMDVVEGKVSELVEKFGIINEFFMGFIDGISESLKEDIVLEEVEVDKEVFIKIDWEKLYNNMVIVEVYWLYNL